MPFQCFFLKTPIIPFNRTARLKPASLLWLSVLESSSLCFLQGPFFVQPFPLKTSGHWSQYIFLPQMLFCSIFPILSFEYFLFDTFCLIYFLSGAFLWFMEHMFKKKVSITYQYLLVTDAYVRLMHIWQPVSKPILKTGDCCRQGQQETVWMRKSRSMFDPYQNGKNKKGSGLMKKLPLTT